MGVDLVREFTNMKSAYERERGASAPTGKKNVFSGQPLISSSKGVPRTIVAVCSQAVDLLGEQGKTVVDEQTMNMAIEAVSNPADKDEQQ